MDQGRATLVDDGDVAGAYGGINETGPKLRDAGRCLLGRLCAGLARRFRLVLRLVAYRPRGSSAGRQFRRCRRHIRPANVGGRGIPMTLLTSTLRQSDQMRKSRAAP